MARFPSHTRTEIWLVRIANVLLGLWLLAMMADSIAHADCADGTVPGSGPPFYPLCSAEIGATPADYGTHYTISDTSTANSARTSLITALYPSSLTSLIPTATAGIDDPPEFNPINGGNVMQNWSEGQSGQCSTADCVNTDTYASLFHLSIDLTDDNWSFGPLNVVGFNPTCTNDNTADLVLVIPGNNFNTPWNQGIKGTIELLLNHCFTVAMGAIFGAGINSPSWGDATATITGCTPSSLTWNDSSPALCTAGCQVIVETETACATRSLRGYRTYADSGVQTANYWKQSRASQLAVHQDLPAGDVHAVGLSGGGWNVSFLCALDVRYKKCFSIAGSDPQWRKRLDRTAYADHQYHVNMFGADDNTGVLTIGDMWILCGYGASDRLCVQVINTPESGLFGGDWWVVPNAYIQWIMNDLDSGHTHFIEDSTAEDTTLKVVNKHSIKPWTYNAIILPGLLGDPADMDGNCDREDCDVVGHTGDGQVLTLTTRDLGATQGSGAINGLGSY